MEKNLLKALINYFSTLERIDGQWKQICDNIDHTLEGLKNFSEQLHYVSSNDVENAEICRMGNVREHLIFKINLRIDEEMRKIPPILCNFANLNQELKNRLVHLETVKSKVSMADPSMQQFAEGNAHRPQLNSLLEWAIDGLAYYQQLYKDINESFKAMDKDKTETITMFIRTCKKRGKRRHIDLILGLTQYLIKDTRFIKNKKR